MVGVLFVINVNPAQSNTPFASVIDVGYFGKKEDEMLFSMHSVFRIGEITPLGGDARLIQVQLNLVSDKDNDLRELIDYIRDETFPDVEGWYRLGLVLRKMGEFAHAEQVYEILQKQETKESAKAPIYCCLGVMKQEHGEYGEAIAYYEKSIEIEEKQIPRRDQNLANSYNNIGDVYRNTRDYAKALSSHKKALAIYRKSLPSTHPDLAMSYNNIGGVYGSMGDHPKALSFYKKALEIKEQSLPSTHPSLAMSYNNIGLVYDSMGDYPKALSFYEKTLTIQ